MQVLLPRLLWLGLFTAASTVADTLTGRVVGVTDGDTIAVLGTTNPQHKIRLAAIDAPEKGQPFREQSKQNLSRLVYGKEVRIDWHKHDRYGRPVGTVSALSPDMPCNDLPDCPNIPDAGLAQLTVGLSWHYKRYADEQEPQQRGQHELAEIEARAKEPGLWGDPNTVPPWEWRHPAKSGSS